LFHSDSSWAKLLQARAIRGKKVIHHHIYSSLWSSIKEEVSIMFDNSIWLLGNGKDINFWNDNWCGPSLSEVFNIPDHISQNLTSSVSDYILNGSWNIPPQLSQKFGTLNLLVQQVTIPLEPSHDLLLWKHTDSGDLQLADAYRFNLIHLQDLIWPKFIWSPDIPPSKSLLVWRLMHNKVPTDENLKLRGCALPSMCNLCCKKEESSFHIFFDCEFAVRIWSWLANCLDMVLQFTCMEDMWKLCELNFAPQCKVVISSALVNLINAIWFARNTARFNNKIFTWQSTISMIIANVSLSGNNTRKTSSNSIRDFILLKHFKVCIHHPSLTVIKEILWTPPLFPWIKCNIDGAAKGNPGLAGCGGVFRNHRADMLCCYAEPLGIASSFLAELHAAISAIEIAFDMHWDNLWIESDSSLVVRAFQNPDHNVTWSLRNRWRNALVLFKQMNGMVSHIFREGNQVADSLANIGCTLSSPTRWQQAPHFIIGSLEKNKLGLPSFRLGC
jgi:ribonuclease HI